MQSVIDTHSYYGKAATFGIDQQVEDYKHLQECQRGLGNDVRFIVMAASAKDNEQLPLVVEQNPDLFYGCLIQINPNKDLAGHLGYWTPDDIEDLISHPQVLGLKLVTSITRVGVDDPRLEPFAQRAQAYHLPLVVHCPATGDDYMNPQAMQRFASRFPDLDIIAAHYGGLSDPFMRSYTDLAARLDHLWLNTAGLNGQVRRTDTYGNGHPEEPASDKWYTLFLETVEPIQDRVLFGTDTGFLHFSYGPVTLLPQALQEKILFSNPRQVFRQRS